MADRISQLIQSHKNLTNAIAHESRTPIFRIQCNLDMLDDSGMRMATIDHAMWFHRPLDLSQWLLYSIDSPNAGGGRGFVRGEFYTQSGELVASATQEGLIRLTQG